MTRPATPVLGLAFLALLAMNARSRADMFYYGLDAGVGPNLIMPSKPPLATQGALDRFNKAINNAPVTIVDFAKISPANSPTTDNTFVPVGHTFEVATVNTDHTTPPPKFQYGITSTPNTNGDVNNNLFGFSTTGTQHFEFVPKVGLGPSDSASVTFRTTGTPFTSFGFFLTGLGDQSDLLHQPGQVQLTFRDKTLQSQVNKGSTIGGELFLGYVGDGAPITSFTLTMTGFEPRKRDAFGISDIRFLTSVPEPSSLALLGLSVGLCGVWRLVVRRRKSR
jgi:hypothetical protein